AIWCATDDAVRLSCAIQTVATAVAFRRAALERRSTFSRRYQTMSRTDTNSISVNRLPVSVVCGLSHGEPIPARVVIKSCRLVTGSIFARRKPYEAPVV